MTTEIALALLITIGAIVLFMSGKLRVDVVALLVLATLALTRLITPAEALSGFSNPAVVTVWAVFILSGGLSRTGVAGLLGNKVLQVSGDGQIRLLFLIMLTAAVLSAFMNNVGVAALMLPVVIEIARRTNTPPSKLLLPLAIGALLGGMVTLIGTPPNILASDALRDAGLQPFAFFDFAPIGLVIMLVGLLFMAFVGHRLLPKRNPAGEVRSSDPAELEDLYQIQEEFLLLRIPEHSTLSGMSLAESQLGSMLGLNVIAIIRNGKTRLSPLPTVTFETGDRLVVVGEADQLAELRQHQVETIERSPLSIEQIQEVGLDMAELTLKPGAPEVGKTIAQVNIRVKLGVNILAIRRGDRFLRNQLPSRRLRAGDALLVQGPLDLLTPLRDSTSYQFSEAEPSVISHLNERLLLVCVPPGSALVDKKLKETNLGESFGLTVLRIARGNESIILPKPDEQVLTGDMLLVQGPAENVAAVRGLERLELDPSPLELEELETNDIGLVEAVLSPHTRYAGKTLRELRFRDKYGLNVLAILRGGQTYRHDLRDMPLRFGDALLLHGARDNFMLLGIDPEFIVLIEDAQEPPNSSKAPLAVLIMAAVLVTVLVGLLPIAIAAIIGGTVMVLTKCLTMEEAYRYINWPAVFLIAAMLPLGIAMQNSGATQFLVDGMMRIVGDLGPLAVLAGLFLLSMLSSQVMPNAAVVVLMAPIAISTAGLMGVSPHAFMMGIAIAASASFLSPVSHPANVLVMGPGGYRFSDYIKVGLPLTFLVFGIVLLILPLVWRF